MELFHNEVSDQEQLIGAGDLSCWETGRDAQIAISCIYDHLDAFRLIVCRSQWTKYENFLHEPALPEEETALTFMELMKSQGIKINECNEKEFHLLTTTNVNAVFQTIEHNFTHEKAMHYAETPDHFFSKAWKEFFGY